MRSSDSNDSGTLGTTLPLILLGIVVLLGGAAAVAGRRAMHQRRA